MVLRGGVRCGNRFRAGTHHELEEELHELEANSPADGTYYHFAEEQNIFMLAYKENISLVHAENRLERCSELAAYQVLQSSCSYAVPCGRSRGRLAPL